jgi:hypothetical protein
MINALPSKGGVVRGIQTLHKKKELDPKPETPTNNDKKMQFNKR